MTHSPPEQALLALLILGLIVVTAWLIITDK